MIAQLRHSVWRPTLWLVAATAVTAAPAARPTTQDKLDLSANALARRTAAYVADYQKKFAFLVASETYAQTATSPAQTRRRVMHGELYLTFLPADREWVAVHDIADVDGEPVPDRETVQTLLQRADVASVAQRVINRNAKFNIGSVGRNFNEPTLALLVFEAKRISQFRFERKNVTAHDGVTLATLAFTEHDPPTLVKGDNAASVFSRGEVVVEADTGRVRQSRISFKWERIEADLVTEYVPEDRLQLWVPSTFSESYADHRTKLQELTTCVATYSNYRRFEATGRIK